MPLHTAVCVSDVLNDTQLPLMTAADTHQPLNSVTAKDTQLSIGGLDFVKYPCLASVNLCERQIRLREEILRGRRDDVW
jgi:hypothetical protein